MEEIHFSCSSHHKYLLISPSRKGVAEFVCGVLAAYKFRNIFFFFLSPIPLCFLKRSGWLS
jgi:hypothetical protein